MRLVIRRLGDICIRRRYLFFRGWVETGAVAEELRIGSSAQYYHWFGGGGRPSAHTPDSLIIIDLDDGMGP